MYRAFAENNIDLASGAVMLQTVPHPDQVSGGVPRLRLWLPPRPIAAVAAVEAAEIATAAG